MFLLIKFILKWLVVNVFLFSEMSFTYISFFSRDESFLNFLSSLSIVHCIYFIRQMQWLFAYIFSPCDDYLFIFFFISFDCSFNTFPSSLAMNICLCFLSWLYFASISFLSHDEILLHFFRLPWLFFPYFSYSRHHNLLIFSSSLLVVFVYISFFSRDESLLIFLSSLMIILSSFSFSFFYFLTVLSTSKITSPTLIFLIIPWNTHFPFLFFFSLCSVRSFEMPHCGIPFIFTSMKLLLLLLI